MRSRALGSLLIIAACGEPTPDFEPPDGDAGFEDAGQLDAATPTDAGDVDAAFAPSTSFAGDVAPILQHRCQGCHFVTDNPPQILIDGDATPTYERLLSARSTTADLALIAPGRPEESYLWHKVHGTQRSAGGAGNRMPPPVASPMTPAELATVDRWIEGGALP